jgi:hypothetical protein
MRHANGTLTVRQERPTVRNFGKAKLCCGKPSRSDPIRSDPIDCGGSVSGVSECRGSAVRSLVSGCYGCSSSSYNDDHSCRCLGMRCCRTEALATKPVLQYCR